MSSGWVRPQHFINAAYSPTPANGDRTVWSIQPWHSSKPKSPVGDLLWCNLVISIPLPYKKNSYIRLGKGRWMVLGYKLPIIVTILNSNARPKKMLCVIWPQSHMMVGNSMIAYGSIVSNYHDWTGILHQTCSICWNRYNFLSATERRHCAVEYNMCNLDLHTLDMMWFHWAWLPYLYFVWMCTYLHILKLQLFDPSWVALKVYSVHFLHAHPVVLETESLVERLTMLNPTKSVLPSVTCCYFSCSFMELFWNSLSGIMAFCCWVNFHHCVAILQVYKNRCGVIKIFMQYGINSDDLAY